MKRLAFLVAAAAAFGLAPIAAKLGPIAGSALSLALGVALALAASGTLAALAAAGGALGAFAGAVLATTSPAVAGAALVGLAFAERTTRIRGGSARVLHAGAALGGGALAGVLARAYASASPAILGVAVVVAAVLSALPLLLDADDPVAHALDLAADDASEPARTSLREGAELRRTAGDGLTNPQGARQIRGTWRSLLKLAEAQLRLDRARAGRPASPRADAVAATLAARIEAHVGALTRAYVAVDTAHAAEASLDDRALREVERVGESLEEVSALMAPDAPDSPDPAGFSGASGPGLG